MTSPVEKERIRAKTRMQRRRKERDLLRRGKLSPYRIGVGEAFISLCRSLLFMKRGLSWKEKGWGEQKLCDSSNERMRMEYYNYTLIMFGVLEKDSEERKVLSKIWEL